MSASRNMKDYTQLSGSEKAAILLLAIGEESASKVFAMMDDEEIKELSLVMAQLGSIDAAVIERLIFEFADQMGQSSSLAGTMEGTERFLGKVLGKRADGILDDIRGPRGRTIWDKLGYVPEQMLANYLKNEYPQTAAVVLSKVGPAHAAKVLAQLPDGFAMEVVTRMLRLETVPKDVLDDVESILRNEFMSNVAKAPKRDRHETIAEIFNELDPASERRFLTALDERNPDAAQKVRDSMFKFEDLQRLDPAGIQTLMRAVDKGRLALALKGASETVRDMFLANMSERAGRLMRDDMAALGPVRVKDVADAQHAIVELAKQLADRNEIALTRGDSGSDELIY
ncbi:MAG: flagellar motor switch protein FliG [Alphaproteobacteria bacterium]|nr:flagellar motor switch protein FliG [Alphaproteobacteria bacterium]